MLNSAVVTQRNHHNTSTYSTKAPIHDRHALSILKSRMTCLQSHKLIYLLMQRVAVWPTVTWLRRWSYAPTQVTQRPARLVLRWVTVRE